MICPFCEKEVSDFHPNSHIIPEWMYEENSYDEKHRAIGLNLDNLEKENNVQQGYRGSFICRTCETNFSKNDRYGSLLLSSKGKDSKIQKDLVVETRTCQTDVGNTEVSFWSNFKFKELQNFIFSILIRDHLWRKANNRAQLNDEHYQKIKILYLNETLIDDVSYPILVVKLVKNGMPSRGVFLPYVYRFVGDHRAYAFKGAGFLFHTLISSHRKPPSTEVQKIQKDGNVCIVHMPFEDTDIFKKVLPRILKIRETDARQKTLQP